MPAAGGGALPRSLAQAPPHNNSKVQAYWRTLGPGWNGGSGAAGGDATLPGGELQQVQPPSGMSPVSPLAIQGVDGSSQGHSPREQVPALKCRVSACSSRSCSQELVMRGTWQERAMTGRGSERIFRKRPRLDNTGRKAASESLPGHTCTRKKLHGMTAAGDVMSR